MQSVTLRSPTAFGVRVIYMEASLRWRNLLGLRLKLILSELKLGEFLGSLDLLLGCRWEQIFQLRELLAVHVGLAP